MQLTNKARYAITAMLDLATSNTTKPVTLDVISNRQNISLSYLEQLFAKLRKAFIGDNAAPIFLRGTTRHLPI
jgi:Rrf2 family iron-sulfur cluster assembly transcriptional regulator